MKLIGSHGAGAASPRPAHYGTLAPSALTAVRVQRSGTASHRVRHTSRWSPFPTGPQKLTWYAAPLGLQIGCRRVSHVSLESVPPAGPGLTGCVRSTSGRIQHSASKWTRVDVSRPSIPPGALRHESLEPQKQGHVKFGRIVR